MPSSQVRARRLAEVEAPVPVTDPAILEAYLEDASGAPPAGPPGCSDRPTKVRSHRS